MKKTEHLTSQQQTFEGDGDRQYLLELGARLREIRKDISQKAFAALLDIHENTLKRYENGERAPDALFLRRTISRFPLIESAWLLLGEGTPPGVLAQPGRGGEHPGLPVVRQAAPTGSPGTCPCVATDYCCIPIFSMRAGATPQGQGDSHPYCEAVAFQIEWIRRNLNAEPRDLCVLHVDGESMAETFRPGDMVLVDLRDKSAPCEAIYVLKMDGALLLKHVQRLPGGLLKVSGENQAYEPFTIKADEMEANRLEILGRVVWACRRY